MPLSNEINDPAVLEKGIPKKVSHHIPWLPCVEPARFGDPMKSSDLLLVLSANAGAVDHPSVSFN